jgi:hypothetical protein
MVQNNITSQRELAATIAGKEFKSQSQYAISIFHSRYLSFPISRRYIEATFLPFLLS